MKFLGVFALSLIGAALFAEGRIEGNVVDDFSERSLAGAIISISELARETTSDSEGKFIFENVPAGDYEITTKYLGYTNHTTSVTVTGVENVSVEITLEDTMENMVITGQVSSSSAALNQQRASEIVSSILSSDDFGQLPDANLSEALQRIPGVFLERDQGEGRFIGIRGIDPGLNAASINGVTLTAPENSTRAVALDVIPSELLETLIIKKSFTPDMDPEGIGGSIEVKSFSAFVRKGPTFKFKSEITQNQLESTRSPKLSARFSNRFPMGSGDNEIGVAGSFSYYDRDFGSDNMETDGGWFSGLETVDGVEFKGAEEIEQRNYQVNRTRLGFALNIDFKIDDRGEYFIRTLFSELGDQEYRNRTEYKFDKGDAIRGTATSAMWEDANIERSMKDRYETQEILSLIAGGEYELGEYEFDFSMGVSQAMEEEPGRIDASFKLKNVDLGYTYAGNTLQLFGEEIINDPDEFELDEIVIEDNFTSDYQNTLRFDIKKDFDTELGEIQFKVGTKLRRRDKENDQEIVVYDGFPNDPTMTQFLAPGPNYGLGAFGPGLDPDVIATYISRNANQFDRHADDTLVRSAVGDYNIQEDVDAFFIMSKYKREKLSIVYGVRFEDTSFSAKGQRVIFDDVDGNGDPTLSPFFLSQHYHSVLPSINVRYAQSDVLILRSAFYRTIARPSFGYLKPGGKVEFIDDDGVIEFKAELGNPNLEPLTASNFDASVEYYDPGIGLLAASYFHKKIDSFIVLADVAERTDLRQFVGDISVDDAKLIAPINGNEANINGVELTFTKKLNKLPTPFDGLLLATNLTLTDSEAILALRDTPIPMPKQSDHVFNISIGYETQKFSFRFAGTSKSDVLIRLEEPDDPEFDVYQSGHTQYDFSAKFYIGERVMIYLEGNNLTDEPYYAYYQNSLYNSQYEEYGRTIAMGWQYRM